MNTDPTTNPPSEYPARERIGADHDEPYTWDRLPDTYLSPREIARLMVLRSRLQDPDADLTPDGMSPSSGRLFRLLKFPQTPTDLPPP
jgi:hypothetical protein